VVTALSPSEVAFFRTFGYLFLPEYLDAATIDAIGGEVRKALPEVFGSDYAERAQEQPGAGPHVPLMATRTPISLGLVDDERFFGVARQLLGAPILPTFAEAGLYLGTTGLHPDANLGMQAVKFVSYLEPLSANDGALRLIPGSHHLDFFTKVEAFQETQENAASTSFRLEKQVESLPCQVIETMPGDVLAFDVCLWHASIWGSERHQWTVSYVKDPIGTEETQFLKEWVANAVNRMASKQSYYDAHGYYVYDREWVNRRAGDPTWGELIARMRELGFFHALAPSVSPPLS
jgi:hypothetical protein